MDAVANASTAGDGVAWHAMPATASDGFANIDAVRVLDQRVHHAWWAAAYLAGAAT